MDELDQYIRSLPKAELHLHLEGAVDIETLCRLAERHGLPPPRDSLYRYDHFGMFLKAFKVVCDHLVDAEDYRIVTRRLAERLHAAGAAYAEVYIAAGVLLWQKKPLEALFDGIDAGYREARADTGVEMRWIFDATRQFGAEAALEMTRHAVRLRDRGVIGIGIGGDENNGPPEVFRDVYEYARGEGLRLTAHAGETAGPASVWGALRALGAERIGHGLRAIDDPGLVAYLAEKRIPVDVCVSSNVCTGAIGAIEQHPLRRFFDAGLLVSLATDDPAMFGTDLVREYRLAHDVFGFTRDELAELAANSFRAAFCAPERA